MPAKAGIQEDSVLTSCSVSWIPGLASLARNDVFSSLFLLHLFSTHVIGR